MDRRAPVESRGFPSLPLALMTRITFRELSEQKFLIFFLRVVARFGQVAAPLVSVSNFAEPRLSGLPRLNR
jgi:hypothetical protein